MAETAIEPLNDAEGERLMQLGQEVDAGRQDADTASSSEQPEPRTTGEGQQETPPGETAGGETSTDSSEPAREEPETEQEAAKPEEPEQIAAKHEQKAPETEYSRAKQEEQRLGRSWQGIQARKAELDAKEAQIAEYEQMRQLQSDAQPMPVITKDGFSRQDYEKAAQTFNQNGDYENEAKALRVIMEIGAVEAQEAQRRSIAASQYAFQSEMQTMMQQDEELRSPQSPLAQTVLQLLDQHPYLEAFPNGFKRTVDIARLILDARSASELREAYEQARAELENRDRRAQPLRGGPTVPSSSPADYDSMTMEQKDRYMEQLTKDADRTGA